MRRAHGPLEASPEPSPPTEIAPGMPGPGNVVGGYRLVRLIGEGSRASVFLGVVDAEEPAAGNPAVAIKLYRPSTAAELIDREVRTLTQVDHPHCLQLLDVATDQNGQPCLILERVRVGALSRMLAERSPVAAGEAVTILAPLVSALDALHRGGVVHGGIRASAVQFREDGAPVLVGFGRASPIEPGGAPPTEPGGAPPGVHPLVIADRVALLALVQAVLSLVPARGAAGLDAGMDAALNAAADPAAPLFADELAAALFDLANPLPVHFGRGASGSPARIPARAVPPSAADSAVASSRPGRRVASHRAVAGSATSTSKATATATAPATAAATATATAGSGTARAALTAAMATVSTITKPRSATLPQWTAKMRTVRPRFWALAGGVAVSLGAALMVVPTAAVPGETAVPAVPAVPADPGGPGAEPGDTPAATVQPGADDTVLLHGDDPVAALTVLLERRDRCVRELSVLCLDAVAQQGSAALAGDTAVVRALQAGGELTPEAAIPTGALMLVERLGDSALVALGAPPDSKPASALVMKGEAGWRIRNYVP